MGHYLILTLILCINYFANLAYKQDMTYIAIDTKTKQAQKFVEWVETMPFVKILNEPN